MSESSLVLSHKEQLANLILPMVAKGIDVVDRELSGGEGLSKAVFDKLAENHDVITMALITALREKATELLKSTSYLKFISPNKDIFVERIIEPDKFASVPTQVYEMSKDGTYYDIFESLKHGTFDHLCFMISDVRDFIRNYPEWLRSDGYGTFFLCKVNGLYLVADVRRDSSGEPKIHRDKFIATTIHESVYKHRVVVPAR